MKNRQKSRSGCRTCKLRRAKPGCRNCAQKGLECPGYQQRLQWSTKHEIRSSTTQASGPANFTQLVNAASKSIVAAANSTKVAETSTHDGLKTSVVVPMSTGRLPVPPATPSASASPPAYSCSSSSSSAPSPLAQHKESAAAVESNVALVPVTPRSEAALPEGSGQPPELSMSQPVVDIPTFLIEHWFKSVCSSWSALDSQTNPYRRLTANLWHNSTPVFYALQAISAASLVERLPHIMHDTARSAPRRAAEAIQKELVAFSAGFRPKFPSELLLALFCMSSSMCWMESRLLGQQFVRQARAVLKSFDRSMLDIETQELLDFFNGCLVYEEMLRSVVSEDEIDFEHMLSWPEPTSQRPLMPVVPHAWTGVSSDVLRLFGKAMALSRRSRTRWRQNDGTSYEILQRAMKDIEEATKIEEALVSVEVPLLPEYGQASPTTSRLRDLHYATEAYRLCALLQLYESFPDLSTKRIPTLKDADRSAVWHAWVSPLALHVTDILAKVPPGSLCCIQPLLCICAGSGLRYDSKVPLGRGHCSYLLTPDPETPSIPTTSGPAATDCPLPGSGISVNAIKISQARRFVMDRLDQLELNLPPKPIGVAKQLMRAVWSAYDEEIGLNRRTHWLDVMSSTGLHSIFG
ncbi:fungal-specific transcription factor domain-containing protein [Achaetomium macrosporum]|uniref:Fungal-specific transcription factor domain-containing protein n=1 Tax=Achaetomium macrosporum TaxID=79813 RepID=A0AAN7HBF3_9PEZI|nr:fungal-specific transcription factor domain-containing protein [Achaetomium macrosporum]